jgi:hypothetical protein
MCCDLGGFYFDLLAYGLIDITGSERLTRLGGGGGGQYWTLPPGRLDDSRRLRDDRMIAL